MQALHGMTIEASVVEVLTKIKANRDLHITIVREAEKGYKTQLEKVLKQKLADLQEGKEVSPNLNLSAPHNHIEEYTTIITMLTLTVSDTVALTAEQVRYFYNDDWSWKRGFLAANSTYSVSAMAEYDRT